MLDYQRIVDDVRSLLYVQGAEAADFMRAAAADYSVACEEVNERLHQCAALLRKGLRSEAIQLADIEPNLLDVVALLDFPERPDWIETAKRCGIAAPTPLLLDVAAELNEAYALEQPLAALLRRHRVLALSRATLPARIEVLRRLADLDIGNPVWQDDLLRFEHERQKQIRGEVDAAMRTGDAVTLAMLDAELASPDWKNPPPLELAKSAAEAKTRLRYWAAQTEFERLATELGVAMSEFKIETGRALRDQWNELAGKSGWPPQEQIAGRAAPMLDWLGDQDRLDRQRQERQAAVEKLSRAVRQTKSLAALAARHEAATQLGELPPELEERYQARRTELEKVARQRRVLQITAAVAGGLILAVLLLQLYFYASFRQEVAAACEKLQSLYQEEQFDEAEAYVKGLRKRIREDSRLVTAVTEMEANAKKEKSRHAEFRQALTSARLAMDEVLKSLDREAQQGGLERLRQPFDQIQNDLDRAKRLAKTQEERGGHNEVANVLRQATEKWQRQLDQAFDAQYEAFERRVAQIENDRAGSASGRRGTFDELSTALRRWADQNSRTSPANAARMAALRERLAAVESRLTLQEQEDRDQQRITDAVGDVPSYLIAIKDYVHRNPQSECAADLKRAAEESLCWQAVAEWNKVARQVGTAGIEKLGPAAAQELLSLATAVSQGLGEGAEGEGLRRWLPYWKAIAQRETRGERIETPLRNRFAAAPVNNVWMVETDDGSRYYTTSEPDLEKSLRYLVGPDGKTVRRRTLTAEQAEKATKQRAPQAAVAQKVLPLFGKLDDGNWEKSFCAILAAIDADRRMDPILKVNLLQQVLETGTLGSYSLEKAFRPQLQWLKEARINTFANWLDPGDTEAARAREDARSKLEGFPEMDRALREAMDDHTAIGRQKIPQYDWIGWLRRAGDGRWECMTRTAQGRAGKLVVVWRRPPEDKLVLASVGRLERGGSPVIDAAAGPPLLQGRPVYLVEP